MPKRFLSTRSSRGVKCLQHPKGLFFYRRLTHGFSGGCDVGILGQDQPVDVDLYSLLLPRKPLPQRRELGQ